MMPDSEHEGQIFYLPLTPMIDSFPCTTFISDHRSFNNAVTSIADFHHIVMTSLTFNDVSTFNDVNLNHDLCDIHITTTAYQTRYNSRFLSYPG